MSAEQSRAEFSEAMMELLEHFYQKIKDIGKGFKSGDENLVEKEEKSEEKLSPKAKELLNEFKENPDLAKEVMGKLTKDNIANHSDSFDKNNENVMNQLNGLKMNIDFKTESGKELLEVLDKLENMSLNRKVEKDNIINFEGSLKESKELNKDSILNEKEDRIGANIKIDEDEKDKPTIRKMFETEGDNIIPNQLQDIQLDRPISEFYIVDDEDMREGFLHTIHFKYEGENTFEKVDLFEVEGLDFEKRNTIVKAYNEQESNLNLVDFVKGYEGLNSVMDGIENDSKSKVLSSEDIENYLNTNKKYENYSYLGESKDEDGNRLFTMNSKRDPGFDKMIATANDLTGELIVEREQATESRGSFVSERRPFERKQNEELLNEVMSVSENVELEKGTSEPIGQETKATTLREILQSNSGDKLPEMYPVKDLDREVKVTNSQSNYSGKMSVSFKFEGEESERKISFKTVKGLNQEDKVNALDKLEKGEDQQYKKMMEKEKETENTHAKETEIER